MKGSRGWKTRIWIGLEWCFEIVGFRGYVIRYITFPAEKGGEGDLDAFFGTRLMRRTWEMVRIVEQKPSLRVVARCGVGLL